MHHVFEKGTWEPCIGAVITGGLSNFVTEEHGTSLRATRRGWGDLLDKDGGNDGFQKAAAEEKMGGFHAAGWRGGVTGWHGWVSHPPPVLLVLQRWKCRRRRQLSERHRRGEEKQWEKKKKRWGESKGKWESWRKPWGWGKSVRVGGKRGNSRRYKHFERES